MNAIDPSSVEEQLALLRARSPQMTLRTELERLDRQGAVFRAEIELPDGSRATGHGAAREDEAGDVVILAEARAISQALDALPAADRLPAAVTSIAAARPEVASDNDLADVSWPAFWDWATRLGIGSRRDLEAVVGEPIDGFTPAQLRARIGNTRSARTAGEGQS